jgi:hypothetical protein
LEQKNITDLAVDKNRMLWVGNATDATVNIVNSQTDALDETVDTNLNPQSIAFTEDGGYVYYLPYLVNDSDYATALALRNLSATDTAVVDIIGYAKDGATVYSQSQTIAPNGQTSFLLGKDLALDGWVQINSSQMLGGLSFIAALNQPPFMADMSVIGELSTSLAIPHVAQISGLWSTVVYICNPNAGATTATLTFFSKSGQSIVSKDYMIPSMGSIEVEMSDLFGGNDQGGGSLTINGTQGVAAFALYNNLEEGGYNFAGLSAVQMP